MNASVRAMRPVAWSLLVMALVSACASSSGTVDDSTIGKGISLETIGPQEAAQILGEFQMKYGIPPVAAPDVEITSMAQVLEIIRADRLDNFKEARDFTAGKQGPEALTVRSYLETSLAGALLLSAAALEEELQQDMTELRRVEQSRPFEDDANRRADQRRAQELRTKIEDLRKVVRALTVLSEEPLESGHDLAEQAIRQDARSQLAYLANANYYRLRETWLEFDRMMRYADDMETGRNPPLKTYLRAMEALQRYVDRAAAKKLLEETLAREPDLVRAQAHLVLVDRDINHRYAQLQKLKAMSPNNIVVRLAGPIIEEEYVTAEQIRSVLRK